MVTIWKFEGKSEFQFKNKLQRGNAWTKRKRKEIRISIQRQKDYVIE